MPKLKIGLADNSRTTVNSILNRILADEFTLYTKTRNYHWNVTGPQFAELHKFFEAQYEQLNQIVDDTAERVRALDGVALGSQAEFLEHTSLKEARGKLKSGKDLIADLLADHETVIRQLRKDEEEVDELGDEGSVDFIIGLLKEHEKMAWMLRAHLE